MYLIEAETVQAAEYTYEFAPYLVSLPNNYYYSTGDDAWVYDVTTGLKPEQALRYGSLTIQKTLTSYNATLGNATFVFHVEGIRDHEQVLSDVVSLNFDSTGTKTVDITGIPAGTVVTVTEIYGGPNYDVSSSGTQTAVIVADGEKGAPASVSFTNEYNGGMNPGSGIVNHFEYTDGVWDWEQQTDSSEGLDLQPQTSETSGQQESAGQETVSNIGVSLLENGETVSHRDYEDNGRWDEASGELLGHLQDEQIVPGKSYEEAISVSNNGSIDSYVRVILNKSWTDDKGNTDTNLSPALIDLNFTEGSGWIVDEDASTAERTILYYTEILSVGETTPALSDMIRIDPTVADKVEETTSTDENGYKTITFTYAYDGYTFELGAEVQAVQTHNAQDAIKSAWGVDVGVAADGTISLR